MIDKVFALSEENLSIRHMNLQLTCLNGRKLEHFETFHHRSSWG